MSLKNWVRFIFLGLVWGASFLWIKFALREVGPFTVVFFRIGFAMLGLLVFAFFQRTRFPRNAWWKLILLGFFNLAFPFALIANSEEYISSGMASILNSTVPLFTILIASIFLKEERFTLTKLIGLLIGFSGVVVLMSNKLNGSGGKAALGILFMLAATFSYASSAVFARKMTNGIAVDTVSVGQMIFAFMFITPTTFAFESPFKMPALPLTWISLLWLGLMASFVSTVIWFALLYSVGPTRTSMTSYIYPLVGVILGVIFLGEQLDWRVLVGGVLIIAAVVIVNSGVNLKRKLEPAAEPSMEGNLND